MFVMPSFPMARASVAAGRWWTQAAYYAGRLQRGVGQWWQVAAEEVHLYRAVGDRRSRRLGHTPHALPINCGSPPGCSGRERRVRLTAMYGGLVTDPVMGLSSGCFVGLELIEGES